MNRPVKGTKEQRTFKTEIRALDDAKMEVSGYAAAFNEPSRDLGGFTEIIRPGAFKRSIQRGDDVFALINHDPNLVLGRRQNGTLQVEEDSYGLKFRCTLNPNSQMARDAYAAIKRGDYSECSFAFCVDPEDGEDWTDIEENGKRSARRSLKNVTLMDVSAVAYPAYDGGVTSVNARSADYAAKKTPSAPSGDLTRRFVGESEDQYLKRRALHIRCEIFQQAERFRLVNRRTHQLTTIEDPEGEFEPVFSESDQVIDERHRNRAREIEAIVRGDLATLAEQARQETASENERRLKSGGFKPDHVRRGGAY
jgi:HK97 family phage prohead protease